MATHTGTVTHVSSDGSMTLHDSTMPPPGGTDYVYADLTPAQLTIATLARFTGGSVTVTGDHPAVTKIDA